MFSKMSSNHWTCFSEDKNRIRFDIAAHLWPAHRLGDDFNRPAEDLVEALAEGFEPSEIGNTLVCGGRAEADDCDGSGCLDSFRGGIS